MDVIKIAVLGVAGLIICCFIASFCAAYLPVFSGMSSGTRTIVLTLVLSAAAALLFPKAADEEEK